jgi:acetyl esterase/lipase
MVAPELRPALRRQPPLPLHRAWFRRLARAGIRRMRATPLPGVTLEVPDGDAPGMRIHRPDTRRSDAALFWIHGGGLVIGGPVQDDRLCASTARELGIVVISVEYRLAPEHPFPAAHDDCHTAWAWVRENAAALDINPSRMVVGGQSAGGGLAAALVQRLHDAGGPQPIAQWLLSPMLDDRTAARRDLDAIRHRTWNNKLNRFGWRSYLATDAGSPTVPPYAVPARREDLAGLPPAWISVGDIDLFHDEDRDYADRLRAAGVDTTFHVVPDAPHGFETFAPDTDIVRDYLAAAQAWLRQAIAQATSD